MPADPRIPLVELDEALDRMIGSSDQREILLPPEEASRLLDAVVALNAPNMTGEMEAHAVLNWAFATRARAKLLDMVIAGQMTLGAWFEKLQEDEDGTYARIIFKVGGRPMTLDEAASILCSHEQEKLEQGARDAARPDARESL